ncbi:MlaD family protein [Gordonia sp. CPCC 205333]|uniref:MlaD family protein n=1 Tax=Gordonia sp. CPCC 205333 TaxID=3140790 RepID=UPI003AF364B4
MRRTVGLALKLGIFAAIVAACLTLVVNSLRTPVEGEQRAFTAVISDVSGLFTGSDVRMSGVQVGKVKSITLDGALARVGFTVKSDEPIFDNTKVAVRYQSLVGQRYVELIRADQDGSPLPPESTIPLANTIASFDVSVLFNGLQPLFTTLDPAALNTFGENLLRVIQGDGSGIGPALRDIEQLSKFASNRQQLITVLIGNLGIVSQSIAGKSQQVGELVKQLNLIVGDIANRADGIVKSSIDANETLTRGADLLGQLEAAYDDSYGPLDSFLRRVFPPTKQVAEALALLPTLITGFNNSMSGLTAPQNFTCTKGRADIPGIGSIVLANQRLVVCR